MDAAQVGTIIQAVATVVALAGVAVSFWLQRQSHELSEAALAQERELAEANASRAEAAARLTEDYSRRVVDALEVLAAKGVGGSALTPPKVAWELVYQSGDTYRLTNVGDAEAVGVNVTAHESMDLLGFMGGPDLGPGEAMTFMAAPSMATSDFTVKVAWVEPTAEDDPLKQWRYPLPYQARR